jgi:7 transmembrane receptor (rhodopsin family)
MKMDTVGTATYVEDDDVSDANVDEDELFYFYLWTVATPTLFTLIVLVGAVGNVAVILVIVSQQTRHSPTNLLLVNLALADLAFLFVCVPVTAIKYAAMNWPFNDLACKVSGRH